MSDMMMPSASSLAVKRLADSNCTLRQVAALAAALAEVVFLLPSGPSEVDTVQTLAEMLHATAATTIETVLEQIETLTKSEP